MTAEVLRLDYKREPPNYCVGAGGDFQNDGYVWWNGVDSAQGFLSPEAALFCAWAHYRATHAPPNGEHEGARYLAWVWYERCLAVADALATDKLKLWPAVLGYKNGDLVEIEMLAARAAHATTTASEKERARSRCLAAADRLRQNRGHADTDRPAVSLERAGMQVEALREASIALIAAGIEPGDYIDRELGGIVTLPIVDRPVVPPTPMSLADSALIDKWVGSGVAPIRRGETDSEMRKRVTLEYCSSCEVDKPCAKHAKVVP